MGPGPMPAGQWWVESGDGTFPSLRSRRISLPISDTANKQPRVWTKYQHFTAALHVSRTRRTREPAPSGVSTALQRSSVTRYPAAQSCSTAACGRQQQSRESWGWSALQLSVTVVMKSSTVAAVRALFMRSNAGPSEHIPPWHSQASGDAA